MGKKKRKHRREEAYVVYKKRPTEKSPVLFGWTDNRATLELLFLQRDIKKYSVRIVNYDEIRSLGTEATIDGLRLDLVQLQSNRLKRQVTLVTTREELNSAEAKVQRMFSEACALSPWLNRDDGEKIDLERMIIAINNLQPKYSSSLETIGHRVAELNSLFDSVEDDIYDYRWCSDHGNWLISKALIYSLESIVRVLLDEM